MSEPIFKIREPDGKEYKIYANGQTDGFEQGAVIVNGVLILLNYTKALIKQLLDNGLITAEEATRTLSRWPFA